MAKTSKKNKTVFVCQECGHESPQWVGQCICGAWNSMVEEKVVPQVSELDNRRRTSGYGIVRIRRRIGRTDQDASRPGLPEFERSVIHFGRNQYGKYCCSMR